MSKRRIAQVNNAGFEQENFIVSSKLEFYKREKEEEFWFGVLSGSLSLVIYIGDSFVRVTLLKRGFMIT